MAGPSETDGGRFISRYQRVLFSGQIVFRMDLQPISYRSVQPWRTRAVYRTVTGCFEKLKDKEKYPALITVDGGLKKRISVFHLPTSTMAQIPGTPVPEKQRLKFRKTGLVFQDMKTIGRIYRMLCGVKETITW